MDEGVGENRARLEPVPGTVSPSDPLENRGTTRAPAGEDTTAAMSSRIRLPASWPVWAVKNVEIPGRVRMRCSCTGPVSQVLPDWRGTLTSTVRYLY